MARRKSASSGAYLILGLIGLFALSQCDASTDTDQSDIAPLVSDYGADSAEQDGTAAAEEPSGDSLSFSEGDEVYVTADALNGRTSPSGTSAVVTRIPRGRPVTVTKRSGNWMRVSSDAGQVWVSSSYVSHSRPAPRYTPPPRQNFYGGSCPCSGSNVCIGPRGGRYCITSGGNKRYGV
jgi:uncharacterized protein YgiM (DUF1202 family)